MSKGQLKFKPGTILLFVFIAGFGFFMYNWASGSIQDTGDDAMMDQRSAIQCSQINVDFIGFREDDDSTVLTFQINEYADKVDVSFRGESNSSVRLQSIEKNTIQTARVNGTGYSNTYVFVDSCETPFSYR
ncbi:MAG: hypothetical protein ACI9LV_000334 [Candidatus Nanohaloarchaea archaeon]|jgi:hypothetical protein